MPEKPPQPPNEAQQQARAAALQLAEAFEAVFGAPKKRTEAQKRVVEHLTVCAGDDGNSYRFNEAKDGLALIAAGIHRDGARSMLRIVERQISNAVKLRAQAPKQAAQ